MLANKPIGAGIAGTFVQRRGTAQVGEHQGHLRDTDFVSGSQNLIGKQVSKRLQCGRALRRQRVANPFARFDDQGAALAAPVDRNNNAVFRAVFRRNPVVFFQRRRERTAFVCDIGLVADFQRSQSIVGGVQSGGNSTGLARFQRDLNLHMRGRHGAE